MPKQTTMQNNPAPKETSWKSFFNRPHIHLLILILLGTACYSNTFHVPFILDDEGSIQLLEPVHGLANYFAEGWPGYNYLPNRAFGYLTFALNYEFGGLNLPGYHLVNLLIHIFTALLVYALINLIFQTPYLQNPGVSTSRVRMFAFVVALLFISHPIQTQAVTYIVQRLTSLSTMFYLAAIVCYLIWRTKETATQSKSKWHFVWYLLAIFSTILAMKTKEIAFTLPIMILLVEYTFFGVPRLQHIVKMTPQLLTILIIPLTTYFKISPLIAAAPGGGSLLSDQHTPAFNAISLTRPEYIYTQFSVITTYLRLLFLPINQHLDYDYPINHSLLTPRTLLSLSFLIAVFGLAIFLYVKSNRECPHENLQNNPSDSILKRYLLRLAAFGIFWFFITLSIESSIILILDVFYEHRLYLPSFGFFLSLTAFGALGLQWIDNRLVQLKKPFLVILACFAIALPVATYYRNNVWSDWITLWSDNVAKTPDKPRPHNILGIGYYYRMEYDKALVHLREAVRIKPDYAEPYFNMGLVYKGKKEYDNAVSMFDKVLKLSASPFPRAHNEIGICYAELGYSDQALEAFASAVKYEPESVEYRNNYAFALSTAGNIKEAIRQYEATLKLEPENSYALQSLQELNTSENKKSGR